MRITEIGEKNFQDVTQFSPSIVKYSFALFCSEVTPCGAQVFLASMLRNDSSQCIEAGCGVVCI